MIFDDEPSSVVAHLLQSEEYDAWLKQTQERLDARSAESGLPLEVSAEDSTDLCVGQAASALLPSRESVEPHDDCAVTAYSDTAIHNTRLDTCVRAATVVVAIFLFTPEGTVLSLLRASKQAL